MTSTIILIVTAIIILTIFLISSIIHITKIKKYLIEIDKEQHEQNKEILSLMKGYVQHQDMLLQHIEILKYLCEQDPALNADRYIFGQAGEA